MATVISWLVYRCEGIGLNPLDLAAMKAAGLPVRGILYLQDSQTIGSGVATDTAPASAAPIGALASPALAMPVKTYEAVLDCAPQHALSCVALNCYTAACSAHTKHACISFCPIEIGLNGLQGLKHTSCAVFNACLEPCGSPEVSALSVHSRYFLTVMQPSGSSTRKSIQRSSHKGFAYALQHSVKFSAALRGTPHYGTLLSFACRSSFLLVLQHRQNLWARTSLNVPALRKKCAT